MNKFKIFESETEAKSVIPMSTIRKIQIDDKQYCLAHTKNGFKAFQKECNHAGGDLSKGKFNAFNQIVCPLHAYMFDLKSGEEDRNRCSSIVIYDTFWEEGALYINNLGT